MRSPGVPALGATLPLGRALRPLRRRVASRSRVELDEEQTAHRAAESGAWLPVTRPARSRWLDVALVVDDSASMVLWRRTAVELRQLLQRLGAFRDVRSWRLDTDADDALMLRSEGHGRALPPRVVRDPTGRRLVLILSDCVGRAWGSGALSRALRSWGEVGPVAIVQPLPARLWGSSGVEVAPVALASRYAATPNTRLVVSDAGPSGDHSERAGTLGADSDRGSAVKVVVPVLELHQRWLEPWARLVADPTPQRVPAVVTPASGRAAVADGPGFAHDWEQSGSGGGSVPAGSELVLARYEAFASTEALRLASCLAAAPLTLPVMRLVQQAVLPGSRPSVLAEVFLGGLLQRRPDPPGGAPGAVDPEEVEYDFQPGVRDRLLLGLGRDDRVRVLAAVSDMVAQRLGSPTDFRAVVTARPEAVQLLEGDLSFARVALRVLRDMGGRYGEAAEALAGASTSLAGQLPSPAESPGGGPGRGSGTTGSGTGAWAVGSATVTWGADLSEPVPDPLPEPDPIPRPRVVGGVPERNRGFVGREDLLAQLREALEGADGTVALVPQPGHESGGVGKTELATEYVWRYAEAYDVVWWVPSERLSTTRFALVRLAEQLGLTMSVDASVTIARLLDELRTRAEAGQILLVFDNASPDEVTRYLPGGAVQVLVTSRDRSWATQSRPVAVGPFSREETTEFLGRTAPRMGPGQTARLAAALGDLPLALRQAAAWLGQARATTALPVLLDQLEERIDRLRPEADAGGYPVEVVALSDLAYGQLRQGSPEAARLLEACAHLGAEPIPTWLLTAGRGLVLSDELTRVLADAAALDGALRDIERYALARVSPETGPVGQVQLHRLVRAVVRRRAGGNPAEASQSGVERGPATRDEVHRLLGAANPGHPDQPATWSQHEQLSPHVFESDAVEADEVTVRRAVLDQIRYRFVRGDYERSRDVARYAVERWRVDPGLHHEHTLLAQRHLATALQSLGELDEAARLGQETLRRIRSVFGPDHELALRTVQSVGNALRQRGQVHRAFELDEDSVRRCLRRFGDRHDLTLAAKNNLAVDHRLLGDNRGALRLTEELHRQAPLVLGADHPTTLLIAESRVQDYLDAGRYRTARGLLGELLPRATAVLGAEHRVTLMVRRRAVTVLRRLGATASAIELVDALISTVGELYPLHHELALSTAVDHATTLLVAGDVDRARETAEDALVRYGDRYGTDYPLTAGARVTFAAALRTGGDVVAALDHDEAAFAAARQFGGADHPYALDAAIGTASDRALLGEHAAARDLSEDTYARCRRARGPEHPQTLVAGLNLARDLLATSAGREAQSVFDTSQAALRRQFGDDCPAVQAARAGRRAEPDLEIWDT